MPAPVFFCLFRRRRKLEVPKVHINGIFGNVQLVGNGDHGILQLENSLLYKRRMISLFLFEGEMVGS